MHLTPQAQAVMLLTVPFGKSGPPHERPLSNSEWARFAIWLKDHGLEPAALLKGDLDAMLAGWMDRTTSIGRIRALLGRGAALGLALEKWQRAGLWVLTRADQDYPERLKRRLRSEAPAVLFGCGNKALLNAGGIAVVGSRDADEADLAYTEALAVEAAAQGHSIVSGGARGVDQCAMLGALKGQGTALGVLADSLLRSATSSTYRTHIMAGDLTLVSPFNPEAGFNVGNAMSRNRYIYCLADAAVVVSSTLDKGGTWNGAVEGLQAGWVPLWVKPSTDREAGNRELVRRGARFLPEGPLSVPDLLDASGPAPPPTDRELPLQIRSTGRDERPGAADAEAGADGPRPVDVATEQSSGSDVLHKALAGRDFYEFFIIRLIDFASGRPVAADDIADQLELEKSQVNAWLKRGVAEGGIFKEKRPVRYRVASPEKQQASLFEGE